MIIFNQVMKRIFQNKIKLLVLLIMPLMFIGMFAMQNHKAFTIGIVDRDNSTLSQKLISSLKEIDNVKVVKLSDKEVYDKAVSYQTEYSIIIETGFEAKIISGGKPEIEEFYLNEKEKLFYSRNFIEGFISNMSQLSKGVGFDKSKFQDALKQYQESSLTVVNISEESKKADRSRLAMGFLVQFLLYMSVITASVILEDKSSGVFYRIFSAPVSIKRYISENLLAFFAIGAAQVTIILAVVQVVLGLNLGSSAISMYLLFIVFAFMCISLGVLIVSLVQKPLFAYMIVLFITTPLVMLGGCYWPMELMPNTLLKIGKFIPTTYAMGGVDKLLSQGKGFAGIASDLLVLLLFAGIFLAGGIFKKVDVSK